MPNTLTIDLDKLTKGTAEQFAGFILTLAGCDFPDTSSNMEDEPEIAFGKPEPITYATESNISSAGPQLVIPENPTPAAPIANASVISHFVENASIVAHGATGTLDKEGLPWDARIHSSNRSLNADGTWRQKRGIDEVFLAQVKGELKSVLNAGVPTSLASAQVPPPPPTSGSSAPDAPVTQVPSAIASVPPPPPSAEPTVDAAAQQQAYVDLMGRCAAAMGAGKISHDQITGLCNSIGLASFPMLGVNLHLVPVIAPMIDGIIAAQA